MTRVDFYVLPSDSIESRLLFACRLCDKVVKQGHNIMVLVDDENTAQQLDELMWSYRPESFLPHSIATAQKKEDEQFPVLISHDTIAENHHDLLINLKQQLPKQFSRFARLAEIVVQKENVLNSTRDNYKFYTSRGYPTFHHKI